ncbi:hypothetical protein V5O48_010611 [Marasmius crinis-equi]|uniref:SHSP domain-containing protein n=1 Tax=Marasmius crinis-equi TaxID=585013 RepID=A0ABR3F8B5_9AGAR
MSVYHYQPFYDLAQFFNEPAGRQDQDWPLGSSTITRDHVTLVVGGNDYGSVYEAAKPRVNIKDNPNNVVASFELPGMKKEDLQIEITEGHLTVSEVSDREGRSGKFSQTLRLPHGVKEDEIKAVMENGVLTVTFPKVEPRRITIS